MPKITLKAGDVPDVGGLPVKWSPISVRTLASLLVLLCANGRRRGSALANRYWPQQQALMEDLWSMFGYVVRG